MSNQIKKIVVIGPESTGKSMLCTQLAEFFKTDWVKEYAREYLISNGKEYTINDLDEIVKGQIRNEENAINQLDKSNNILFIDTDMYVMKVWSEYVFNACNNSILNEIVKRKYDLYLLCEPDLPWVADELRTYPDYKTRELLYHYYKEAMTHQQVPWININGDYEQRLQKSIKAVNGLF